ncbi:MAG: hypothetical protein JXA30_18630 [Deltaproteobacteria bacterium]|nr:hypothetical protein [Deltaproteobacteria bacterium]
MYPNDLDVELQRAGALFVEPRLMRQVVVADRRMVGLGLQVPHTHCYGIGRSELLRIVGQDELGVDPESLPAEVVLLAPLPPSRALRKYPALQRSRIRRYLFHARIHLELERKARSGELSMAEIRKRIDRIGHAEFDEIRAILRQDDLLLPPYDDRQQYIEFSALYLELRHFAPELLTPTFPSLENFEQVDAVIALDVNALQIIANLFPDDHAGDMASRPSSPAGESDGASVDHAAIGSRSDSSRRPPSGRQIKRMMRAGDEARSKGNQVRSALLYAHASRGLDQDRLVNRVDDDLRQLTERLRAALCGRSADDCGFFDEQWIGILRQLALNATQRRLRYPVEARLLFDLQRAAIASERVDSAVDLKNWILSLGKKPLVRSLPATREVRIARHFRDAARKILHTRIAPGERRRLAKVVGECQQRADRNLRSGLRAALADALDSVGLIANTMVEEVAREKLVDEILDEIAERGFVSFGHLRDALSRNQLKLNDLSGGRGLLAGDELLRIDRLLAQSLDGVYRPGEIYLRAFQRLTSLLFGTAFGRFLFLFLILPFGGSYLLLEGLSYIVVSPICSALGFRPLALLTPISFFATALFTLGLVHLRWLRAAAKRVLGWIGWIAMSLFIHLPRWILHRRAISRLLGIGFVRAVLRRIVSPLAVSAPVYFVTRRIQSPWGEQWPWVAAGVLFIVVAMLMSPRMGILVEELMFDWVAPRWRTFSHQVVPGLLRLIADLFRRIMNSIERGMYRVDELLRFRAGQSRIVLAVVAVGGLAWGVVAYLVRMYITLFVEPELNPLKHFPVATVAHKLTLPVLLPVPPAAVGYFETIFSPVVTFILGTFVSVTVFIMPSVAGFLAWELKENRKLYRAARPKLLEPIALGSHGKTMAELLTPGLHSGTLPKLYERLRRGAQREDDLARATRSSGMSSGDKARGYRARFREGIQQVETDVRRLLEREILPLLSRSKSWSHGRIDVEAIDCGSNRIRVRLACPAVAFDPCEIAFEEQDGTILASIAIPGFIPALYAASLAGATLFENALVGLYCMAGVDFVNEQITRAIGDGSSYGIVDKFLVVWPNQDYHTELLYKVRGAFIRKRIHPRVRGRKPPNKPPALERDELLFNRKAVSWLVWNEAWQTASEAVVPTLLQGPSILPARRIEAVQEREFSGLIPQQA